MAAGSIGAAMGEGAFQLVKDRWLCPAALAHHHSRNPTHDEETWRCGKLAYQDRPRCPGSAIPAGARFRLPLAEACGLPNPHVTGAVD